MLRKILTLTVNNIPTQYYIKFGKDRQRFSFQPTLKNKEAPVFVILVRDGELKLAGEIDPVMESQAMEKVKEILSDNIFDKF